MIKANWAIATELICWKREIHGILNKVQELPGLAHSSRAKTHAETQLLQPVLINKFK